MNDSYTHIHAPPFWIELNIRQGDDDDDDDDVVVVVEVVVKAEATRSKNISREYTETVAIEDEGDLAAWCSLARELVSEG